MQKRSISLFSATMLALSSLIGSGWLFGSSEAASVAGPAAVISWVIGAVVIGIVAFNYIELGVMLPESGGMSRYPQYSHGPLVGFIASWANWLSLVALIPIEAVAAVQYMSTWPWAWANWTNDFMKNGQIVGKGLIVVFLFMVVFTLLNFWSVSVLTRFTNLISVFKIAIPLLTIILLMSSGFYVENFGHNLAEFMPNGSSPVFEATTVSGIILSYNAFQTVINIGGEIKDPQKNIFRAITISLTISTILYIMLQVAYIGAITPSQLAAHGWSGLKFASPFADIAILLGIHWLAVLLYLDAFVSPFGTGVSFAATSGRTLAAMTLNRRIPKWLGEVDSTYGNPRFAYLANFAVGALLVLVFRDWSLLASVMATATLIAYATGPVTVMAFRKLRPNYTRPVHSKLMPVIAPLTFVIAGLAIYWAMWPTTVQVIFAILLGLPIYMYYDRKNGQISWKRQLKSGGWLLVYLAFLSAMSYAGSKGFNGQDWIKYPYDFLIIIVVSLVFYYWGLASRMPDSPDLEAADKLNKNVRQSVRQCG